MKRNKVINKRGKSVFNVAAILQPIFFPRVDMTILPRNPPAACHSDFDLNLNEPPTKPSLDGGTALSSKNLAPTTQRSHTTKQ